LKRNFILALALIKTKIENIKKSLETGVDNMLCNGFVPVAFLVTLRFILNQITFKKNTNMEQIKNRNNTVRTKIMNGIKSTIETVWAIGTSIAGAIALNTK